MFKKNENAFDINATQKMSRRTRNRILYGNALGIRLNDDEENPIKKIFDWSLVVLGRTVNVLLITNPLLYWLWVLLFPAGMGDFLSEGNFWHTSIGGFMKKLSIRTAETILPTGRLFQFMEALTPSECSEKNQLKYFNYLRLNGEQLKKNDFSSSAQKKIWAEYHCYSGIAERMLEDGYGLDDDEKCSLIEEGRFDILAKYSAYKTLSMRVMKALYASRQTAGKELFFSLIAKHGAQGFTPEMVAELDRPRLREALREFSQLTIVRREQQRREDGSAIFFNLAKSEKLFLRTEKEISIEQYNTLHSLCKNLSKEAILFKSNPKTNPDWVSWVDLFLKWEDLRFPEWELLVLQNPELRELVLKGGRKN